jgi:hypothetical protein
MLTVNFAEIIQVVRQQFEVNTIDMLSAENIGNINLMLRGYVGLIQNGFETPNDSELPSEQYSSLLLELLSKLTPIQENNLKNKKKFLLDNLMDELNAVFCALMPCHKSLN